MMAPMAELFAGTVTLLFTDIEGSTRRPEGLGDAYADALAELRRRRCRSPRKTRRPNLEEERSP